MKQIFLDTNIWIDYCWRKNFSRKVGRHKKKAILIHKLKIREAKITISTPLLYEVSSHFKDYFILQDMLADGFGAFEFSKIKRDYKLGKTGRKKVDEIYSQIVNMQQVKGQLLVNWINESTFEKVFKLTSGFEFDFLDAMHVIATSIANCDVFVTKDESLLNRAKLASKKFPVLNKINFVNPKTFNEKYKTLFKK